MTVMSGHMLFRDLQIAQDIGKRAALGWFDVEFTMHGCAYLENGKRKYKVSTNKREIYEFIEERNLQDVYPSNIMSLTKKCAVPAGMREEIAWEVKRDLARKLQQEYSEEFLQKLQKLGTGIVNDTAAEKLWEEADRLEGIFEEKKLQRFQEAVDYCYKYKKINKRTYLNLIKWIKEERKNMQDDFISKDINERTFYAIAHLENERLKYTVNADKAMVYDKMYKLEQNGILTSPIYWKTYWFGYNSNPGKMRDEFSELVKQEMNMEYMNTIKQLCQYDTEQKSADYVERIADLMNEFGDNEKQTLVRYLNCWGIDYEINKK